HQKDLIDANGQLTLTQAELSILQKKLSKRPITLQDQLGQVMLWLRAGTCSAVSAVVFSLATLAQGLLNMILWTKWNITRLFLSKESLQVCDFIAITVLFLGLAVMPVDVLWQSLKSGHL